MKIIILGGGQVGGTLAETLANEQNDITIVDTNEKRLRELQERFDIGVVIGCGSHPDILQAAGGADAEMLIAVTNSDEVNMVACQIAHALYRTPTKIARIRSTAYTLKDEIFSDTNIPIDVRIAPEDLVTQAIHRLLINPGALQVLDFADGMVSLVAVKAYYGGPLVDQKLRSIRDHMPSVDTRVAAIFRRGEAIMPEGDTIIEADDEVFFIADAKDITAVMSELRRLDKPYRRITIAGGGNIGKRLAELIEKDFHVKLIEFNPDQAYTLSEDLSKTVVLAGSATDEKLLKEEHIQDTDVFCALTNDDEANIMSSMLAKRLGATKTITLISNPSYVDLVQGGEIDIAISPQLITIGKLLRYVRRGHFVNVHSLRRGAAEAIEVVAHGDKHSSKVVGRKLSELKLPPGTTIGALVREIDGKKEVLIAHDHIRVQSEDHVIMFLVNKKNVADIEKLFQVSFSFF
ncbi:Trk system potassium transporter TrkA [Umboniibacter marinipuniceus]|uniref:Trk system potassium uptake protein TrkA n=1 Tax=Umboniibacter marinipuniceus TaxID=569599 RepID=A0A3M0AB90_9GAMM|nr:Trk system potassium transporter TrkA [Umboniibacter marinipuniceus]RMA82140.1 trk system potassium uptake protein TrkA [Umboniibacter marinipuniceus]